METEARKFITIELVDDLEGRFRECATPGEIDFNGSGGFGTFSIHQAKELAQEILSIAYGTAKAEPYTRPPVQPQPF